MTTSTQITLFKHFSEIDKPLYSTIEATLKGIKEGKVKTEIEQIRASKNQDEIKKLKLQLPCVLFAGKFDIPITKHKEDGTMYKSFRNDTSLSIHSRFVPFDIDDVDDVETLKSDMMKDEYIYAVWKSPSGTGVHGLIKIADGNKHEQHYSSLIKRYPQFDSSARNPSRVLFFSYDPNVLVNENSKTFFEVLEEEKFEGMVMSQITTDYKKLDIAARMIRSAEMGTRHNAVVKASYLVGGYIAGGLAEESIAREVLKHEVYNKFDGKDVEIEYKAVDDGIKAGQFMPINELAKYQHEVMQEAGIMEEELSFLSSNLDDEEFIRRYKAGLIPMGLTFGYDDMDKYLLLKEGEFYATLSHSHTGKTTVNLWLIFLSALKYDWGWVIYTGENRVSSLKMKILEFYMGMKIKESPEEHMQQGIKWLNERFFFINNETMHIYKDILKYAEKVSKYHSIKGVLIDPINALKTTDRASKYDYEMEMYTDMLLFTKRTNISLFISIHTRTQSQRERDKDGNQIMPYPADADGGAVLYNKADIFITMNRNIQDPNNWMVTELYVNKMRNKETGGDVTPRNTAIRIRMQKGLEFTDDFGGMPFKRDYLKNIPKLVYHTPTTEDAEYEIDNTPF